MKQRSEEWHQTRLGKVTASRFKDVLTAPKSKMARDAGELSQSAHSYLCEKVAEVFTQKSVRLSTKATQWGIDCEPLAVEAYENRFGPVQEVGFIDHPNIKGVGGSPDGLRNSEGMIEVKCPYSSYIHMRTFLTNEMPDEHMAQIQGLLWITGRKWCDFVSFDPRVQSLAGLYVKRIPRHEKYIYAMAQTIQQFRSRLDAEIARVQAEPEYTWELPESWEVQEPIELVVDGETVRI